MQKLATAVLLGAVAGIASLAAQSAPRKSLDIYYIDTEVGQSTLFVSPTGESLLVDTGNAGGRDLDRILEAIIQKKDESAYIEPDNGASAGFLLTFGKL